MTDTNNIGAGGEEWRRFENNEVYQPHRWADSLNASKASIESNRKRDVAIRILDRKGKPVVGKTFQAKQTRSEFTWGVNLWGQWENLNRGRWNYPKPAEERRIMRDLLNAASAMHYWAERPKHDAPNSELHQGYMDYDELEHLVDWGLSAGLTMKGHPLFWSIPKAVPEWVKKYDYETQMKFLEVRIRTITARFKGKITQYDVVNEPIWEAAFKNLPNRDWPHIDPISDIADYIEPVMRWAREEDPNACYLVNEYGVLKDDHEPRGAVRPDGTVVTPDSQLERLIQLMEELLERGAAPNAVGLQSHTGAWGYHDREVATFDAVFERTGLPCQITEFWAHTHALEIAGLPEDEILDVQFEFIKNSMTTAFGHPQVDGFYFWGMLKDMTEKGENNAERSLLYHRLYDLLKVQWMTDEQVTTDAEGVIRFRGFHGDYQLVGTTHSGQEVGQSFQVRNDGPGEQSNDLRLSVV